MITRADAVRLPFADASMDLVIGSPPYIDARLYLEGGRDLGISRNLDEWVAWMLAVTREALRVSRGLVLWVCAGDGGSHYTPGPEGLLYQAHKAGIPTPRPDYWLANKPPTGANWFTNTVEYVLAFGEPAYFDPTPLATPVRYGSGGAFRMRSRDGERVGGSNYPTHGDRKTVPNGFYVPVGGGRMGHPLASENEAPYPVGVPSRFIATCTPKGGAVLDPFAGSGTTLHAARDLGRVGIGCDLRLSQCQLSRRRLATVTPVLF